MAVETIDSRFRKREFWRGARASVPVIVAVLPFGLLFGALAVGNGVSVFEATLMSGAVYGGASQMVGIELFGNHVAPWLIVASIFVVNFRHVLYSAAFGRRIAGWPLLPKAIAFFFLSDPQYAEAERKAELGETVGFAWYIGMAAPIWISGSPDRPRRLFRRARRQSAGARAGFPAADLFPRTGHELPQAAAVAAGRGGSAVASIAAYKSSARLGT